MVRELSHYAGSYHAAGLSRRCGDVFVPCAGRVRMDVGSFVMPEGN